MALPKIGTFASVKVGANNVANLVSYTITDTKDAIEYNALGTTDRQVAGLGVRRVEGNMSGYLDPADTTGQDLLAAAYEAGTTVSGLKFYIDDTTYYASDTSTDTDAGVYITSWTKGATQNEIVTVEFSWIASGDWAEFTS